MKPMAVLMIRSGVTSAITGLSSDGIRRVPVVNPAQIAQTQLLLARVEGAIEHLQVKRADLDRTLRELREIRGHCIAHLKGKIDWYWGEKPKEKALQDLSAKLACEELDDLAIGN